MTSNARRHAYWISVHRRIGDAKTSHFHNKFFNCVSTIYSKSETEIERRKKLTKPSAGWSAMTKLDYSGKSNKNAILKPFCQSASHSSKQFTNQGRAVRRSSGRNRRSTYAEGTLFRQVDWWTHKMKGDGENSAAISSVLTARQGVSRGKPCAGKCRELTLSLIL